MSDNIEGLERRRLARAVKICLDVLFYLLVALGVMWAAALAISSFTDYDEGWEVRVPVAIGEVVDTPLIRPFFTLLPVETAPSASTDFVNVRIWEARGKLRFLHHSLPLHLGNSAAFFLFLGVSLWAIALLRRILATTAGGRPGA